MVKKKAKKKITTSKKRRFYEIFKIKKKGKEKTIKIEGSENIKEKPAKEQIKKENKILRNIFILIGIIAVLFLLGYLAINNIRNFEYQGINFEIVKFCDVEPCLILYQTSIPVIYNGEKADYNFYLRNDPRDLEKIELDGNINLLPTMIIDSDSDFNCNGNGIIAMANFVKLYEIIGTEVIKNEELDCSLGNEYIHLEIQEGNKTKIIQPIPSCYVLMVNNCEILEVTEKFMVETFVKVNKDLI
tara:strand:+ start:24296 stop:25027 length:732 start_codon:yes stop_codon:yes gene_type:complete